MSTVTISTKRNRVYQRKFDHDEARALHAEGWTYTAIAELWGVTPTAVQRVCDDRTRERMDAQHRAWVGSGTCPDCGTATTRLRKDDSSRCTPCANRLMSKVDEESGLAHCARCKQWKPLDAFSPDRGRPWRGVRTICRACDTIARQAYRERRKIPCDRCGRPRLPQSEKGSRRADTGLCHRCYHASRRTQ